MDAVSTSADADKSLRRHLLVFRIVCFWLTIVSFYFLWEAATYTGLFALIAEWQFHTLSLHLPVLSYLLLVCVFGGPALALLRVRRRSAMRELDNLQRSDRRLSSFLAIGVAFAAIAIGVLVWMFMLPSDRGPATPIAIGSAASDAPEEGHASLSGTILFRQTVVLDQHLILARRGIRFAPIIAPGATDGTVHYFVEVPADQPLQTELAQVQQVSTGILRRNGLPGSVLRLFRYAGFKVEEPYYVLYGSNFSLRWPCYVLAAYSALGAAVLMLAALAQRWSLRRRRNPRPRLENAPPA
jgi:hypothetical protein